MLYPILIGLATLVFGLIVGYFARKVWAAKQIDTAEAKLHTLIQQTKNKQKEMLMEARDKSIKLIADAKREAESRRRELTRLQERLEKRESLFDQKLLELEEKQQKLYEKANRLESAKKIQGSLRKSKK